MKLQFWVKDMPTNSFSGIVKNIVITRLVLTPLHKRVDNNTIQLLYDLEQ